MKQPHVGIQMTPHSIYDEGIEEVLDVMEEARVNALYLYSTTFQYHAQPWMYDRPDSDFADHGVHPIPNSSKRALSRVWFKTHPEFYDDLALRPKNDPERVYGEKDVFDDLVEPAARRGIDLYARVIDAGEYIDLFPESRRFLAIDMDGDQKEYTCPSHPDHQAFWENIYSDLFTTHPYLKGLKHGHERGRPLQGALGGDKPDCFCPHCLEIADRRGINRDRVKKGYRELIGFGDACRAETAMPDGVFVEFWRILMNYPEILAWDKMNGDLLLEQCRGIYRTLKRIRPEIQVGWHIFQQASFSPFFRAHYDIPSLCDFSDFIKPVVYSHCAFSRLQKWALGGLNSTVFRDLPRELCLQTFYHLLGYDPSREPGAGALDRKPGEMPGLSPDYVAREVRRHVEQRRGDTKIFAGIGFDMPDGLSADATPEHCYDVTRAAFQAGADGLIISREYDEMCLEKLNAVGRAIDDIHERKGIAVGVANAGNGN